EDSRHEIRAEPLDFVWARLAAGENRRVDRLDGNDRDVGVLLLEVLSGTGDRAAGADSGHEDVDVAVGVVPDLRTRGRFVDRGVGLVLELAGEDRVVRLLDDLGRLVDGALHALGTRGED